MYGNGEISQVIQLAISTLGRIINAMIKIHSIIKRIKRVTDYFELLKTKHIIMRNLPINRRLKLDYALKR